jgi:signal transduction histidine kinase
VTEMRGLTGWSLRQRVTRAVVGVLVLLMILILSALFFINRAKNAGDELVDQWDPAFQISQNTLTAMVNEETGVRGYAIAQDEAALAPYNLGRLLGDYAISTLHKYLLDYPDLLTEQRRLAAAIDTWIETVAKPVIAQVMAGDPGAAEAASSTEAQAAFNRIRDSSADLTSSIDRRRAQVTQEREQAFTFVWIVIALGAVILIATGAALARGLRRQVLRPVRGLVAQTRQVAAGNLDHEIAQDGPLEIQELASDVDLMRETMAAQIARIERARARIQQRSAELVRSNADLEQFAYVASHDLSEPLRKVTNFCQLLERQYADQLDDRARQYIAFMVDGAKRMQALISDLLEFSRVGRSTDQFRPVDLELKLERALGNLEEQLRESGAVVEHDRLPSVPGDGPLLSALLQNLIGNAVKYRSPDRVPHVRITVEQRANDCLITVDDNGIGIDPQYADRIFTIFQRLHLRDEYGGTGIGLALCRKIVEFHRGSIWLADKTEPGARFKFTLPTTQSPLETVDDDEPALRAAP